MKPAALRRAALLLASMVASIATLVSVCRADAPAMLDFSPAELRRIESHGPWPPPTARDAGNAQSGRPDAVAFGQQLFFDTRLSPDGRLSCASCHAPAKAFADGRARSMGRVELDRNAPSLWNAVHERWYGWDGAADSLWSQSIRPLLDEREMASSAAQVAKVMAADGQLACRYRRAFGRGPMHPDGAADQAVLVNAAKAIGAFVATLVSGRSAFDDFRDALAQKDLTAASRYPLEAQRGLRLFIGRGQCSTCHVGPMFSNGEFADTGLPFFIRPGVVDPGRHGGILALRADPHNLLSAWSDDPHGSATTKTRHVDLQPRHFGEFKVPSLRNVALTAPYMHDGQLATIDDVLGHYSELNLDRLHADGEQILKPLRLTALEQADLLAFLRSLSDPAAQDWRPATGSTDPCVPG